MNANKLEFEKVYNYSGEQKSLTLMYYGMTEDRYVFIPYDLNKKYFCGAPNSLTEKEVLNQIKPIN